MVFTLYHREGRGEAYFSADTDNPELWALLLLAPGLARLWRGG